jgi:lipoprotein-releasing system permease protein
MHNSLHGSVLWAKKLLSLTSASRQKKKHMAGTFLVMAFSVIPLIVVILLANGMTEGISRKYIQLQSGHMQVYPEGDVTLTEIVDQVSVLEGVTSAAAVREGYGAVYSAQGSYTAMIRGVPDNFLLTAEIAEEIESYEGSLAILGERNIILGETVARTLGVTVGEKVALAVVDYSRETTFFKPVVMEVSAVVDSGYSTLNDALIFIHDQAAEAIFASSGNSYAAVRISSARLQDTWKLADELRELPGWQNTQIITWDELNKVLFRNFAETKNILYVVMALIVLIAGVNVSSSCIMLIQENYTAIGIMKAVGAYNADIQRAFLLALMTVSMLGTLAGTAVGLLIGINLNSILSVVSETGIAAVDFYLIRIPLIIDAGQILAVAAFTAAVAFTAVVFPLRRLKHIEPLKILTS